MTRLNQIAVTSLLAAGIVTLGASSFSLAPAVAEVTAAEATLTEAKVEEIVAEIKEVYFEAQKRLEELPQDRFDRSWVLEQVDSEVERIVDWVGQSTRWVPYQGALRGAEGVLLDRQGNSLDRSLLLAALLTDAGYETRLVTGRLSNSAVKRLLQQVDAESSEPRAPASYSSEKARAVVSRTTEQAAVLAKMVNLPDKPWSSGLEQTIADHWWVEAKLDSGWQSFDPQLNGLPEIERPQAAQRMAPEELPEDLFHQVTVRVVIERWDQGKVSEEIPLEHTLRPANRAYHDLELQFVPFGFEEAPDGADAKSEAVAVADTAQDWLPLIRMGKKRFRQQGFGVDGRLERNPAKMGAHRRMEDATSAMGGLGRKKERPIPVLSACWIEYAIEVPGRDPEILRREIFDLIGPARRRSGEVAEFALDTQASRERGLALSGLSRILITSSDLPPIALERASFELWALQGPQIAAIVRLIADPKAEEPLQRFYREPLIGIDLLALAVARGELSKHKSAIYLASPNILTTHFVLDIGDDLEVLRAVDLVFNEVGVVAGSSSSASRIRLEQGVLDTVLEVAMSPIEGTPHNTSELFAQRGEVTGKWRVSRSWPDDSSLPAAARARMAESVEAGRIVVAPESVSNGREPAWWVIDPETGVTLGIGSRGWGQMGEEPPTRAIATGGVKEGTERIGFTVACGVAKAMLRTQGVSMGLVVMTPGGIPLNTPAALQFLLDAGCR